MKKFYSLLFVALLPLVANAYDAEIDGIYYNCSGDEAEVTSNPDYYKGEVNIPSSFIYDGKEFSVTSIGIYAFEDCDDLTSVTIPNSVTSIGECAFSYCSSLTSVTIPNSVTSIGENAFCGCDTMTTVTIPESVTSIGRYAFAGCDDLTTVTIPNSVTSISAYVFQDCSGLTSVSIPNSVTTIGSGAFSECISLTTINIPNSVTTIGLGAFSECISLTTINIPNSVTSIGNYAFYYCSGLTSITIPGSVTKIGESVFLECSNLTSVTLGYGVTSIGTYAFLGCSNLTSVIIPNSVTSIYSGAFRYCSSLTYITIPNNVTYIGSYTFSDCNGLTSVTIPNSVTRIANNAFDNCSGLTSIIIGSGVREIGSSAFANCSEVSDVYCYALDVPYTYSDAFNGSNIEYATLHVPTESIEQYKAKEPWSLFKAISEDMPELPKPEKCATPTISYTGGKLIFASATEGTECATIISDSDIKTHYGNEISLTATYTLSVYATKATYENSDTIQATLCWIDQQPATEGIVQEDAVTEVKALPVLIQTQGGTITIQGAAEGTPIAIYDLEGKQHGSTISDKERATIATSLRPGSTAVVKIGEKAIKVLLR